MNRMKLCLLAVLTFGQGMAEAAFRDNPTEMTTSIVNPSFEDTDRRRMDEGWQDLYGTVGC